MSIRGPTGSTQTRRSTTTVSLPRFGNTDSRRVSTSWPPRLDQEVVVMRARVLVAALVLIPLGVTSLTAQTVGIREVTASERSVVPLNTKIRYTTMIVLPDDEEILDVVCGDRDFWVISAAQNIAHIKPAKAGAETNVNLVTTTGNIYSFVVTERSAQPDLKVYVRAAENRAKGKPRFFSAAQMETVQGQLAEAR